MKTILITLMLALASWGTQAQVTASTDTLALPPTLMPGDSAWLPVIFTNATAEPIEVYGTGSAGPFANAWECSGGTYIELPPFGTCTLYVRFQPRVGQPLGLAEGLVGFRLATGTIDVDLVGFSYTNEPLPGVRNLLASIPPLGFVAPADRQLLTLLGVMERKLADGQPNNDMGACGPLRPFIRLVEQEGANGHVSEWSAVAAVVQAEAVGETLGCRIAD